MKGKKTLHPLIATASSPISRPVMVAIRLRKGEAADVRGAARFLAEALTTVRAIAPTAQIIVRADSKFYTANVAATAARYGAAASLTLIAVFVTGLAASAIATRAAMHTRLLDSLRSE